MTVLDLIEPDVDADEPGSRFEGLDGKLSGLALAALPGLLVLYLSFNAGGYFPGSQGVAAAILAGSVALRMMIARDPFAGFGRPLVFAVGALALYTGWCLISSRWSHAPARALLDFELSAIYLFALILFGSSARSHRRVRWTLALTWLAILSVCVASLATRLRPDLFPVAAGMSPERLSFPLTYWNALGLLAVVGLILAAHLASSTREARAMRVLASAAIPVFAVTILLTYSRAALVLGLVGLMVYLLLARPRGALGTLFASLPTSVLAVESTYHAKLISNASLSGGAALQGRHVTIVVLGACLVAALIRFALLGVDSRLAAVPLSPGAQRRARTVLGMSCVIVVLLAGLAYGGQVRHQVTNFTQQDVSSGSDIRGRIGTFRIGGRLAGWQIALDAFNVNPLHGHGAGTFGVDWVRERPDGANALETHSLYLEAMSELGIVGLLLIAAVIVTLIIACWARCRRRAARSMWTVLGVVGLVWATHAGVDWDWEMPAVTLPVVALTGCALARTTGATRWRPGAQIPVRILFIVAALAVVVVGVRINLSDQRLIASVADFNGHNCQGAVVSARSAISAVSSRPQPYEIIGYCDVVTGAPKAAVAEMSHALQRDPQNWRYHYGLAVASAAGGVDPVPILRRAQSLNPREPIISSAIQAFRGQDARAWGLIASTVAWPVSTRD